MTIIVAIDGPAGSGKSSVAKAVAAAVGYGILDTGSAYRALAHRMRELGRDLNSAASALQTLAELELQLPLTSGEPLIAAGADVTAAIREPQISALVSRVSKHHAVRQQLNQIFRERVTTSGLPGVVIEGRDITTVVFPDADVRLILTASAEVRAARRQLELPGLSLEQVRADLAARDAKDLLVVNFLDPAPGVQLVDTTDLDFAGSVAAVIAAISQQTAVN